MGNCIIIAKKANGNGRMDGQTDGPKMTSNCLKKQKKQKSKKTKSKKSKRRTDIVAYSRVHVTKN